MLLNRRAMIQKVGVGMGAVAATPILSPLAHAASGSLGSGPRRVVFFMQTHGVDPATVIPAGMKSSGSLAGKKLPVPLEPLQPYTERMHIINGLHGLHVLPSHSAYFGALGGYRCGRMMPASGPTIDHVLSETLPPTIMPHLCIGFDSLTRMETQPTIATLSARGANQPIFMQSNPNFLYRLLYGGIAEGEIGKAYRAQSKVMARLHRVVDGQGRGLPPGDALRYEPFVRGIKDVNDLKGRLGSVSDQLRKVAPSIDDRYSKPKFETDWHDVLLDLGISALKAGITNTLTVGSGRGEVDGGSWVGLGVETQGHTLGHLKQPGNEIWDKIRQYNARMLVKIVQALESVPEGKGTMMDNTLIVYASANANKQHTKGENWPMVLLGNFGGRIKTGRFTQVSGRPINALWATILEAASGKSVKSFNMDDSLAKKHEKGNGPIKEVLV